MKLSVLSKKLWCVRKQLILLLTPLLFLPLLFTLPEKEGKCLYVVVLMAMFWCTEALPLAVTAMLPICLFPTLGILSSKTLCPQYFLETNFLFLSGLVLASSIEEWGLHRRIALKVLSIVGVKPAWLILGMMATSSFLSMWLSNTATTAMMLPIANAILESLFGDLETLKQKCKSREDPDSDGINGQCTVKLHPLPSEPMEKQILSTERMDATEQTDRRTAEEIRSEAEYQMNVWKGFLICIPYSSSIGGTATLTGTAPNLIFIGQLKSYFPDCDVINFGSWFAFAFPLMVVFLFLGWLWISYLYGGLNTRLCFKRYDQRAQAEARARALIEEDYRKLGPINFAEGAISFFFVLFAVMLFTRDPKFVTGWSVFFKKGYVSDAVTGVVIVSILFFFPSQKPSLRWWFDPQASNTPYVPLLSWKKAQDSIPWNIILLLGGGFAMAKACEESGLAAWIGGHLQPLAEVPPAAAVMLITAFLATFTEFASNTATIIIFLPVIAELANRVSVNPLYFMIPATVGCSYAFMLPVSTPPNSIAFASGHLMVKDMVKTGFVMNILGILSVALAMNTWGVAMFNLNTYPEWAHGGNNTDVHLSSVASLNEALKEVAEIATQLQSSLIRLENFQKLTELQRDLIGIENLTAPGREFIREGCLYKLTKKGLQQRMFFLFSDMLLYTSKGVTATNQFKVHGQLPLHGMILIVLDAPVEESENEWSVPHCFTIYSAQRTIVVAASSKVEMGKWIEDLNLAIDAAKNEKSSIFLDVGDHSNLFTSSPAISPELPPRYLLGQTQRPNTITHVCWYRNQNLSLTDYLRVNQNQLSGYLLRKFKNSNGWQKLWVVFTNFCLFFYKTHQDDFPLASLPLLGYTVSTPEDSDSIHKDYVFKLQFKSHVYFFRAESEYTFERWMEVIKSAASTTGRIILLIPKEGGGLVEMNGK
ncbi:solute carrier family 13 member 3 [Solea senegalensis]|uniref:Solute carrier family 13 member 3 n=1 Tax=Solea senegalensis TaxID=28829 RepID=A0AAV6PKD2_SOLSE|nr:solute carrier family 13 member 3 [Solea senegalensis]